MTAVNLNLNLNLNLSLTLTLILIALWKIIDQAAIGADAQIVEAIYDAHPESI